MKDIKEKTPELSIDVFICIFHKASLVCVILDSKRYATTFLLPVSNVTFAVVKLKKSILVIFSITLPIFGILEVI